jgi:TolB-like protein
MTGKRVVFCVVLALVSMGIYSQSMSIDEAIDVTASEMGQRLQKNSQIAVLNFSSQWKELSGYVIDEMNNAIVRAGSLTVVNRQQLDLARRELNFNMSGEVSDESAQRIGKFLGAQLVMTGSFTVIGGTYRFRIQVITVETGAVPYSNSLTVNNDKILVALMPKPPKSEYNFFEKLGIGLLNIPFGLGSMLFEDNDWGFVILGSELGGAFLGFMFYGVITTGFMGDDKWGERMLVGTLIGLAPGVIIGFFRGFFAEYPKSKIAMDTPISINIVPVSVKELGVQIVYKLSF